MPEARSNLYGDGRSGVWSVGAGATGCGVMCAVGEICSGDDRTSSGRLAARGGPVGVAVRSELDCPGVCPVVAIGPILAAGGSCDAV